MIPSPLPRAAHRHARACHGALLRAALVLGSLAACAPATGWQRDTSRTCERDQPAVVCVRAWPDRGVALEIGGAAVLPGECVVAPRTGGRVEVTWREPDGRRGTTKIRARPGHRTELALGADGELRRGASFGCDPGMPPWTGATASWRDTW